MALEIVKYDESFCERWDKFVMKNSVNGTFLQTRNFLNYHPEGRFTDASVMVMQGANIVAVIPAVDTVDEGKRCFFSHKGSTFGGIVIDRKKYNISTLEEIFPLLEDYLKAQKYESVVMKCTSDIFSERKMDLLDYYFFKNGYSDFREVSFFVECGKSDETLMANMFGSRRRGYNHALKNNLEFRRVESDKEIGDFYNILCKNLTKFDSAPVHTLDELLEFKHERLSEITDFYCVFTEGKMIAGAMLFYFDKRVLHTQYLAQDIDYANLFGMNYLDYNLIALANHNGFSNFSFGISTEERGKVLNKGLALFKEGFGCDYCNNRSYTKNL